MTNEQYQKWIRKQLLELAVAKYPGNPQLQMLYQIGFLEAQLAEAMRSDNYTALRFKHTIEELYE